MPDTKEANDHIFKTNIAPDKFEAIVKRACRSAYTLELVAHDPTHLPVVRLFEVNFSTLEDRDRVRIAMRFAEKEFADVIAKAPPKRAPAFAARAAHA